MDSGNEQRKPSNSELMASAKIMSDAVTGKETDRGKIAGAAADVLDAAASYGVIDEKQGVGKYMDQAADYLHKYETTTTTKVDSSGNKTTETTTTKTDPSGNKTTTKDCTHDPKCDDDKCA